MSAEKLEALEAKVRGMSDPERAIATLVIGVANVLDELTHDPVAVTQMAATLRGHAAELGAAIAPRPAVAPKAMPPPKGYRS